MKFLLTSAGLRNDDLVKALGQLLGKPFSEAAVVFVTTAANLDIGDKSWLLGDIDRFKAVGFKTVKVVDIASFSVEEFASSLLHVDLVCFGGGNERYLAHIIEKGGFKKVLTSFLERGGVYMGISAGSMVPGTFLPREVSDQIFTEEDSGDWEGESMEFFDLAFIPHLNSPWFKFGKDRLEGLKDKFDVTVYATDDETAIKIDGEEIEIVGRGETWIQMLVVASDHDPLMTE
jgi:dipeptidase E